MDKPAVLYHASKNNNLVQLDPRTEGEKFADHPLLFATPYKALAAMFLAPKGLPLEVSRFGDRYALLVQGDSTEFIANDDGGTIYSIPSDTFETSQELQMPDTEYVSSQTVTPIIREEYTTAIEAMQSLGVSVYFIDETTMHAIRNAEDHGEAIIAGLQAY